MKKLSIQEAQEKIDKYALNEHLQLLEFTNVNGPCKIKCLTCNKIYTRSQFSNVITSLQNNRGLCKECFQIPKKKRSFEQKITSLFPNEPFTILEYTGNTKFCKIRCGKCGHIIEIQNAKNIFRNKHLCKKCYPIYYQANYQNIQDFKRFIAESNQWELLDDLTNIKSNTKIRCKCKKCGTINEKIMYLYLKGIGCGKCSNNVKLTTEEFKQKLDSDYELLSEYTNNKTKVLLKHKPCGFVFSMTPDAYINQEQRCPKCNRQMSKGEKKIRQFLMRNNIEFCQEYSVKIQNHALRFDFYLPDYNLYIEYQGIQHYEPYHFHRDKNAFFKQQYNDNLKRQYCGTNLLEISYKDFNSIDIILQQNIGSTTIPKGSTSEVYNADGNKNYQKVKI